MQDIVKEIKSYCSVQGVGRRRIQYFMFWLYTKNYKNMNELASKFGVHHSADAFNVCETILNAIISYNLLKPELITISNKEVAIYKYNEELTDRVREYIKGEKTWIELLKLRENIEYDEL